MKTAIAKLWSAGKSVAQIEKELSIKIQFPQGASLADLNKDIVTGNFQWDSALCFVQPDKFNIIDTCRIRPGDGELRGDYSGETLAQVQARYPGAIAGDFEEWIERKQNSFVQPPQKTSESRFMEMLEVLPPVGWKTDERGETFKLSERTSGLITMIFCRIGENYYELSDKITLKHEEIISKCQTI